MKARINALFVAAGAAVLPVIACTAPAQQSQAAALASDAIRWEVTVRDSGAHAPRLRLSQRKSTSDLQLDGRRAEFGAARSALGGAAGPVSFSVVHEAGRLDCSGRLNAAFDGAGHCRFQPDAGFARALSDRGIGTPSRDQQLAMLMVDATTALADGLIGEGVRPKDGSDLIAAAALGVTGAYVHELQSGALRLTAIDDAIACKALGVDGAYVRGLAAAGYASLSSDEVVSLKALGVTPDYARSMNAAARAAK